jgi:hypothetical protein
MAEKTIVVCDVCGRPANETVTIKVARGNYAKDLCSTHVTELIAGARRPRPGRPRKMGGEGNAEPSRRGRPRKTAASSNGRKTRRKTAGRKTTRRKTTRRKAQASSSS